jgi:hypothetical protein
MNNSPEEKFKVLSKLINQELAQDFIVMNKNNRNIHPHLEHCLMIITGQRSQKITMIVSI